MEKLKLVVISVVFSVAVTLALGRQYLDYYMDNFLPQSVVVLDTQKLNKEFVEQGVKPEEVANHIFQDIDLLVSNGYIVVSKDVVLGAPESTIYTTE